MQNQGREAPAGDGPSDGDRPRPKGHQLKEVLLEAGLDLLRENGLALTADTVSYANVFAHLESNYGVRVTRASVHERIWSSHDDFRREVLASSLPHLVRLVPEKSPGTLARKALAGAETTTAQDRINHFSRVLAPRAYQNLLNTPGSSKFQALKVVASRTNDPLAAEMLHPLLQNRAEQTIKQLRPDFRNVAVEMGLIPRPDLELTLAETSDLFHDLLTLLTVGGLLDHRSGSQSLTIPIDFGSVSRDADHAWTPFSIGFASLLGLLWVEGEASELEIEHLDETPEPELPKFEIDQTLVDSPRRTREELKELVLAAGVELLLQSSLDLQPASLSYAAVFERVKRDRGVVVNRGSVHKRIWSSHDDFRFEVLARALWKTGQPTKELARIFESTSPTTRADGSIDRHLTAIDILRSVGDAMLEVTTGSTEIRRLLQVKAALDAQPDSPGVIILREAIQKADTDRFARYSRQMQASILDLGFVIRPELGMTTERGLELFSQLAITSITGATLDHLAGMRSVRGSIELTSTDGKNPEQWTTMGLTLRAYFEMLFVDPDR